VLTLKLCFTSNQDASPDGSRRSFNKLIKELPKILTDKDNVGDDNLMNFVAKMDAYYEYIYEKINAVHREVTGKDWGKVKNYFPIIREGAMFLSDEKMMELIDNVVPEKVRLKVRGAMEARFEKRKLGAKRQKGLRLMLSASSRNYMNQANTYIAKGRLCFRSNADACTG